MASEGTVRTVLTMLAREGCEESFEQIWRNTAVEIAGYDGNIGQSLMRDEKQPRLFVIVSDWQTREALKAFEGSATRRALSAALDPLREDASKAVLEHIATITGRSGTDVRTRHGAVAAEA